MAAMAFVEHRKNKWSFLLDAIYGKITLGTSSSKKFSIIKEPLNTTIDFKAQETLLEGFAGYRVLEKELQNESRFDIDIFSGLRYNYIKVNLDLEKQIGGSKLLLNKTHFC